MPSDEAHIHVRASPERVFDLLHDYDRRLDWDPFLRRAEVVDGDRAGLHVKTLCVASWRSGGQAMETEYISFDRPRVAAVKMTKGPWFFDAFAASIRQEDHRDGGTRVVYRYNFRVRPRFLSFLLHPVLSFVFMRETRKRLQALKRALEQVGATR